MSEYICFLIVVFQDGTALSGPSLLKTALKIKRRNLPPGTIEYPMELDSRVALNEFLPIHAQGIIVEVTEIFEVHVYEVPKKEQPIWSEDDATCYGDPDHDTLEKAYLRIFGEKFNKDDAVSEEDGGDGTEYRMPNGAIVWFSFPGGSSIKTSEGTD